MLNITRVKVTAEPNFTPWVKLVSVTHTFQHGVKQCKFHTWKKEENAIISRFFKKRTSINKVIVIKTSTLLSN